MCSLELKKLFPEYHILIEVQTNILFKGPLMGGPKCRMSILRNYNLPCCFFLDLSVDFQIHQCHLSYIENSLCHVGNIFLMWISLMPLVNFKKKLWRRVNFKG